MESRNYFGCKVTQRADANTISFFVFTARVKDVLQWVGVKRSREYAEGTQRILRETRRKAISRFLGNDPVNTIPNNILLALEPGRAAFRSVDDDIAKHFRRLDLHNGCARQTEWGFLEFNFEFNQPDDLRAALVVDGQHRLFGMSDYDTEDVPMIFVCLLDAPLQEQAFQFIVINSKSVRVPADNAKAIIEGIDEAPLRDRLLNAGVKYAGTSPLLSQVNDLPNSPFNHLLDWDYNREATKVIPLTAIEQSLKNLQILFNFLEDDEDSLLEIFFAVWNATKARFPTYWENPDNKFLKKVNINAMNEFLTERLKKLWEFGLVNLFDHDSIERQVFELLEKINPAFWDYEWSIAIQDNANVRNLIKKDLETMVSNYQLHLPWNERLELPICD